MRGCASGWYAAVVAVAMLGVGMASARAAGDVEEGQALAERWCGSCHVISEAALAGMEALAAPTFMELEVESATDLAAKVAAPHPFMPSFSDFTDEDYENLTAYIQSVADE